MELLKKYKWGLIFFSIGIVTFFSGESYLYLVPVDGECIRSVFILKNIEIESINYSLSLENKYAAIEII
jgi:hypothetical protein